MRVTILIYGILLICIFANIQPVFAQENTESGAILTQSTDNISVTNSSKGKFRELFKNWNARVGIISMYIPEYEGSKGMRFAAFPLILLDYRRFVVLTYMSVSLFAPVPYTKYKLLFGATLSYDYIGIGVTNFNKPEYGIVIAPAFMYNPNKNINASLTLKKSLKGSDGLELELKIRGKVNINKKLEVGAEIFGSYSDKKRMQFKYGVTDEQSAAEGYPAYYPESSFSSAGVTFHVRYNFSEKMYMGFFYTAAFLLGTASTSPTTETTYAPKTLVTLSYVF